MHQFDSQFPYALSDDHYHRLTQIHGTLTVFTELTGSAKPGSVLDCNSLHHALWSMQDNMEAVMQGFVQQNRDMLNKARQIHR